METTMPDDANMDRATEIVAAYVMHNSVPVAEVPAFIASVHSALVRLSSEAVEPAPIVELVPAVSVKKSVRADFIICLEDGKRFKSLKRHLRTAYDMTPEQYRTKWNLPASYPMVAPSYAEQRSALAKSSGLGQVRRNALKAAAAAHASAAVDPAETVVKAARAPKARAQTKKPAKKGAVRKKASAAE